MGLAWKRREVWLQRDLQLTQFQRRAQPCGADVGSVAFVPKQPYRHLQGLVPLSKREKGGEGQEMVVWEYLFSFKMSTELGMSPGTPKAF